MAQNWVHTTAAYMAHNWVRTTAAYMAQNWVHKTTASMAQHANKFPTFLQPQAIKILTSVSLCFITIY
jgi:hypothetical protein